MHIHMSIDATKPVFRVSDKIIPNQPSQPHRLDRIVKSRLDKFKCDTIQFVNSKGADQTAWMRKLVCAFVVCRLQTLMAEFLAYL